MQTIALKTYTSEAKSLNQIINEFIECLMEEASDFINEFKSCLELRKKRLEFKKLIEAFIAKFTGFSEKKKQEILMDFTRAINKLKFIESKEEAHHNVIIEFFTRREFKKLLTILSIAKKTMTSRIYPDNSKKIINNKQLSDKLVAAWGEHAFQKL